VVGDLAVAFGGLDYTDGYVTTGLAPGEGVPGTRAEERWCWRVVPDRPRRPRDRAVSLARQRA